MRFGMCTDLLNAGAVAAAGFDYIDGSMMAVTQASEGDFERMESAVRASGLKVEAMNLMMPGTFRLTGPDADLAPVKEYLEKGFCRGGSLGVKAVSFGASGARNVPEGWPKEKALKQLVEFLLMAAPIAGKYGIGIGVEALNPAESNIVTSVFQAAALARRVKLPNVGVLADWYHMAMRGEGTDGIATAGKLILHTHIASPNGRRFPLPGDGSDYSAFFGALKNIGYDARMSVEGNGAVEEYARSFSRLKECV